MAIIRPSADLRNHYKEISELCKSTNQPVYITVNGHEDLALVPTSLIEELSQTIVLMQKLNEGFLDINAGRVMDLNTAKKKLL